MKDFTKEAFEKMVATIERLEDIRSTHELTADELSALSEMRRKAMGCSVALFFDERLATWTISELDHANEMLDLIYG